MSEVPKFHVVRSGGRVKSAGLSLDLITAQGKVFEDDPNPQTAARITKTFHTLRDNPPTPLRNRFFPLDRAGVKAMTKNSPALYRPLLKNDQGAGQFLGFEVGGGEGTAAPYRIAVRTGYIIPEAYFHRQVDEKKHPISVTRVLGELRGHFGKGDLQEAGQAFTDLEAASEREGIIFRRDAGVGRNGLLFIHPSQAEQPIILSSDITDKSEKAANAAFARLLDMTEERKMEFARQQGLPYRPIDSYAMPFYFQGDMHVSPDGDVKVAELQIPDVGLFLSGLDPHGNEIVNNVQRVLGPIQEAVIDRFAQTIEDNRTEQGDVPVYLVTRSEVIHDQEDVLEIRELAQVQDQLQQRGYKTEVLSAEQAAALEGKNLLFLFNIDSGSDEFTKLARTYLGDTQRNIKMVPDPFFRATEREITDYQHVTLSARQQENLSTMVKEIEQGDRLFTQMMGVDNLLTRIGVEGDILHFYHPALPTPIPAYRYDLRSLQIAARMIKEAGLKNVAIRSIPISPENGMLHDEEGGTVYATFRFMFVNQ